MTSSQTCEQNAKHFPQDAEWVRHCEKMARARIAKENGDAN